MEEYASQLAALFNRYDAVEYFDAGAKIYVDA